MCSVWRVFVHKGEFYQNRFVVTPFNLLSLNTPVWRLCEHSGQDTKMCINV
jgi:hypothetical protein